MLHNELKNEVCTNKQESGRFKRVVIKYNKEIIVHLGVDRDWNKRRHFAFAFYVKWSVGISQS
jgi:predicted sulfurtransferase